jgi:hypothetical protein
MIRTRLLTATACVLGLWLTGDRAQAQFYRPPYPYGGYGGYGGGGSTLSPYLNLARQQGGVFNPAIAYFLGTRPEQQRRNDRAYFGNQLQQLENANGAGGPEDYFLPDRPKQFARMPYSQGINDIYPPDNLRGNFLRRFPGGTSQRSGGTGRTGTGTGRYGTGSGIGTGRFR